MRTLKIRGGVSTNTTQTTTAAAVQYSVNTRISAYSKRTYPGAVGVNSLTFTHLQTCTTTQVGWDVPFERLI